MEKSWIGFTQNQSYVFVQKKFLVFFTFNVVTLNNLLINNSLNNFS